MEETPMKVFMDAGLTSEEQVPKDVPVVNATFLDTDGNPVKIGAGGQPGPAGEAAGFGNITATVDNTAGAPQVSVQSDGPNTAKNISFSFTGLKGEKGEKGDPGGAGTEVNNLAPLVVDTAPTSSNPGSVTIGSGAISSGTNGAGIAIGKNAYSGINGGTVIGVNARSDDNQGGGVVIGDYAFGTRGVNIGTHARVRPTAMPNTADSIGSYAEVPRSTSPAYDFCVALGSYSVATEGKTVSVGSGSSALTLSDDMTEEQKAIARASADVPTRRIVNVTDPRDAQDAATKNYVDTQLTPINTKLQYVPENTNQILSQIKTNAEKAQSAAEAAQTTAESKASQADLTALQATVAQLQETVTQLQAKVN